MLLARLLQSSQSPNFGRSRLQLLLLPQKIVGHGCRHTLPVGSHVHASSSSSRGVQVLGPRLIPCYRRGGAASHAWTTRDGEPGRFLQQEIIQAGYPDKADNITRRACLLARSLGSKQASPIMGPRDKQTNYLREQLLEKDTVMVGFFSLWRVVWVHMSSVGQHLIRHLNIPQMVVIQQTSEQKAVASRHLS